MEDGVVQAVTDGDFMSVFRSGFVQIPRDEFNAIAKSNGVHYPYVMALKTLQDENVIAVNNHYSNNAGKTKRGRAFSKSYALHNLFVQEVMAALEGEADPDYFSAFGAWLPDRVLNAKKRELKKLFARLEGYSYKGWRCVFRFDERDVSPLGSLMSDPGLTLDGLASGAKYFLEAAKREEGACLAEGRDYNWLALIPKKFRRYIVDEEGNPFYEAADMNAASTVWMAILAGDEAERRRAVAMSLSDDDLYETCCPALDRAVTKKWWNPFFFRHRGQTAAAVRQDEDAAYVRRQMERHFPATMAFADSFTDAAAGTGKKKDADYLAYATFKIERRVMERVQKALAGMGVQAIRVHDALYATRPLGGIDVKALFKEAIEAV